MTNYQSFPPNTLAPLFTARRRFDLSESTTRDLNLGDIIDLIGLESARSLRLDYGDDEAGSPAFRQAIAWRWGIPADTIITSHGANFTLYLTAAELNQPGAEAIITAPYFQQAYNALYAHGWTIKVVANSFAEGFCLNLPAIAAALTAETRLVSIASPQNPSGVLIPLETIATLVELLTERAPDAYLLVDETYLEAMYRPMTPLPTAANLSPRVLTCSSVSKAYGAPGLRAGWLTTHDETLRGRLIHAKENIVITDSVLNEGLAAALLNHADKILPRQRAHLQSALAMVEVWQASEAGRLDWVRPDAGGLSCGRLSQERYPDDALLPFWEALADLDTKLRPGLKFGADLRHFRLGFGHVSADDLEQGLANISTALDRAALTGRAGQLGQKQPAN